MTELEALIPGYELMEHIDSGGMGEVYKAVQKSLNRVVAVKLLSRIHGEREGFAERFKRESQALAQLKHPNIVAVHDSGETRDGQLYYVMEHVSGMDLQHLLKHKPPTPKQILQIITQVCNALQYAHERGVVHRDIKPANILIDDEGNVKVADFGLVKIVDRQVVDHTATGTALGTPDYIAPEAMEHGVKIDHRVDIYSLGVMIYELLTGHVPKGQWEPPSVRSGADKKVDAVVSKAMQNDPDKRYQHVSEMTAVLEKLLKTCDSWKNYRRPAKSGLFEPGEMHDPASTGAVTQKLTHNRAASRKLLSWASAAAALLVVGGLAAAWQAGWFAPAGQHVPPVSEVETSTAEEPRPKKDAPQQPAQATDAGAQTRLGHWVIGHGGFVNLLTPDNIHSLILPNGEPATWPPGRVASGSSMRLIGSAMEARAMDELPASGPYVIWRVSLLEAPISSAADLSELARLVREAGTVSNLNLQGLNVPLESLAQLASMTTLVSLDLTGSPVITAAAVPYLAACTRLKLLLLGGGASQVDEAMFNELRARLPGCGVHHIVP
ncbi:MAG TPA: serine/threonine-protein kinase [Prosthecobacter sp.]